MCGNNNNNNNNNNSCWRYIDRWKAERYSVERERKRFLNYPYHPNLVIWEAEQVNGLDSKMRID